MPRLISYDENDINTIENYLESVDIELGTLVLKHEKPDEVLKQVTIINNKLKEIKDILFPNN